jgi:phosphoribosylanthranilate isomerase
MKLKVCGMTQVEQINALNNLNVDFIGFIFYPKSPRYVFNVMSAENIKNIKGATKKTGVFVNEPIDAILKITEDCGLDMVQLHGDESPKECEKISAQIPVIKAFRLKDDDDILRKIKDYRKAADMFLFDTDGAGYGGTGKKFNLELLKGLNIAKPFFLSGGIQSEDVKMLEEFKKNIAAKDLFAVDINSRFEISAGVKDMNKIKLFFEKIKTI